MSKAGEFFVSSNVLKFTSRAHVNLLSSDIFSEESKDQI